MVREGALALVFVAACGRFGFDHTPDAMSLGDGAPADAFVLVTPSCVGLAPTCGPTQSSSCCGSPLVPGGTYLRSYDGVNGGMYTSMTFPATVSAFRLDTYEVTVGRFRKFVEAGMGTQLTAPAGSSGAHAKIANSGWDGTWASNLVANTPALLTGLRSCSYSTWTDQAESNENLPINCINWYEAFAFCIWDGGYLPTEAEWNFAAAGGDEQRAYPWSSPASSTTIDCSYANYDPSTGYCVNGAVGGLAPVGSFSPKGDGRYGQADLAGSLWEKMLDSYSASTSNNTYASGTCNDCADLSTTAARTVRGGAWNGDGSTALVGYRYFDPPSDRYIEMGVRCARPM